MPAITQTFSHPAVLETSRLILKAVDPPMFHHLFSSLSKEEFCHYMGLSEPDYDYNKQMHEKGMETHRLSLFFFLLIDKASGKVIGDCGFHTWNAYHRRAELFYNMRNESFRKQGLMTEALETILRYGYEQLNLHRIEALVGESNEPSNRLLKHFGFTFEGVMREDYNINGKNEDSVCFSLLKHEWDF